MRRLKSVVLATMLLVLLAGCSPASNGSTAGAGNEAPAKYTSAKHTLSSGNFTAGVDFPAGTYNIVALKGGGNVSSSNAYSGGINAIMGTASMNSKSGVDMYEQEYKNIKLPKGTVLSITSVTVEISSDKASGDPITPRNQKITETVTLKNGNFVAGEDFLAGVYDIKAASGGGNVSSDNTLDGGINAIIGVASKNQGGINMYEQEYKNISLPKGTTLAIDGVTVKLVPSK